MVLVTVKSVVAEKSPDSDQNDRLFFVLSTGISINLSTFLCLTRNHSYLSLKLVLRSRLSLHRLIWSFWRRTLMDSDIIDMPVILVPVLIWRKKINISGQQNWLFGPLLTLFMQISELPEKRGNMKRLKIWRFWLGRGWRPSSSNHKFSFIIVITGNSLIASCLYFREHFEEAVGFLVVACPIRILDVTRCSLRVRFQVVVIYFDFTCVRTYAPLTRTCNNREDLVTTSKGWRWTWGCCCDRQYRLLRVRCQWYGRRWPVSLKLWRWNAESWTFLSSSSTISV
jgi:hypothetical protein